MNEAEAAIQFLEKQKKVNAARRRQFSRLDDTFQEAFNSVLDRSIHDGFLDLQMFRVALSDSSRIRRAAAELEYLVARFSQLAELDLTVETKLNTLQSWLLGMSHLEGSDSDEHEAYSTWNHVLKSCSQFTSANQHFLDTAHLAVTDSRDAANKTSDNANVE